MRKNEKRVSNVWRRALSLAVAMAIMASQVLLPIPVLSVESDEQEKSQPLVEQLRFDTVADADKFDLFHSSTGSFVIQDGKLTPTGEPGEFKAIYKGSDRKIKSVSVELHPVGNDGPIYGGLYINAIGAGDAENQINALYVGIESHFEGWEDAKNRIDLVTGSFPEWAELKRLVTETGKNNNLFSGDIKKPIKLQVDIDGDQLTATVSLVSDPNKKVSYTYAYQGADLSSGNVGIRSQYNNACYDNFVVEYENAPVAQETVKVTETVNLNAPDAADRFDMYSSSSGGFTVADGKLVPDGNGGEFKAIYKKVENAKIESVSVDIYPGVSGINGGLYINASDPAKDQDQINALGVMVESSFSGWSDAANRLDLVTCAFTPWKELHRLVSETGAGNNLFSGGVKKPINLKVDIAGNQVTATLRLLSDASKSITTTYVYQGAGDLTLGDVGIRSQFSNATYENFTVTYRAPKPSETAPTDLVDFADAESADKFDFYHSSNGGFAIQDGKLVSDGEEGEFKAIYKDTNASFSYVSVDIYPGEKGINGGLYLDVTGAADAVDQVEGLYVGIESDFPHGTEPTWPDAPNRLDLVLGKFPQWQELRRAVSETGVGNNLFTGGVKEPVNLSVAINGNELTATVRLLSNPFRSVSFVHTYAEGQDLALGNVGIRSGFSDASFDNFAVRYSEVEADKEPDSVPEEPDVPTEIVDFEAADSQDKFNFYHSSNGGFAVQDGKLVPAGDVGEFKAIYKDTNSSFSYVSVDIYPNEKGINGGLYLDVTDAGHAIDQVSGLYVGIESDFPHEGEADWEDAPNRLDLVIGKFPQWQELSRNVSETGAGNNLFTGGVKEPINLSVKIEGNTLTVTVSLLSDPQKAITTTYVYEGGEDMGLGNVGIRSNHCDAAYDNFAVTYQSVEQDKGPDVWEPSVPVEPTDIVDFEAADSQDKFNFYHSSNGGFAVQDGKLVSTGDAGEFKAIYKDTNSSFSYVSVDIYPNEKGINGGLYLDVTDAGHAIDQVTGLYVGIESDFPHEGEEAWEDAPNRLDLVIGKFPQWESLHRFVSETGAGNNLFTGGVKEPVKLSVKLEGNTLTVTVSLLSDPQKSVTTTYVYEGGENMGLGNVGIRSNHCDAAYDNFAVVYQSVEQDKGPDVWEPSVPVEPTDIVDFDAANSQDKFNFYHSSNGGFVVKDGKLVPAGDAGEFKAIYKDTNSNFNYVSVDIYPNEKGINSGLYLDVTNAGHAIDQVTGLYVGIESNFPHEGEEAWEDAPNRLDLVIGKFPQWKELHRAVSETGTGNNLFKDGVKEPVKLSVKLEGKILTVTVSLLSDPQKAITTTYVYEGGENMGLGNVGIRSNHCDAAFDNFAVMYQPVEQDKGPDVAEPVRPTMPSAPTDLVDFENAESKGKFDFYHSSNGGFTIQDGKLVAAGEAGEFKAIYKDTNAKFSFVSVDIYPGASNTIDAGIYLDVTAPGHPVDRINALAVLVQSNFSGWEDAPNRSDIVVGTFPAWKELHRVISETGAGNSLFENGNKQPVNLLVTINGNVLTITLSLMSDPTRYVTTTYTYQDAQELALGNVGIRSFFCDASYDNFAVGYTQVDEDKDRDIVIPDLKPSDVVSFDAENDSKKFDFYHSSKGGLIVKDGKLVPAGEAGEFKAIYRDGGNAIAGVSVDIYPGESGQINSGLYIGTSTVEDGVDRIKGLVVMVESNHSGWEDAVNRIDLVVGRFPVWKELYRFTSETGNGNALFTGAKEPLNLSVYLNGNELIIKLSLLSNPEKYVTAVYEYNGATELPAHNVGLRSAFNDVSFDNFAVYTQEGGGSADRNPSATGGNAGNNGGTPGTGDHFHPEIACMLMVFAAAAIMLLVWKNKRNIQEA